MRRMILAVGVLVCGVAASSQPALAGNCCSKRCEKVAYRGCNKCTKVAFRGCNRCDRVAFKSNRCEKVAFNRCNPCERVASTNCNRRDRGSFLAFLGFGKRHDHHYVSANYATGYDLRYDTRFMPQPIDNYYTDYQPAYEQPIDRYEQPTDRYEQPIDYRTFNSDTRTTNVRLTASQPGSMDASFVRDAAIANMAEIEMGRIALQNASSTEVRNFGQHMIDDHSQALSSLESIAIRMNLDVPEDLEPRHAQAARQLSGLTASEFDRQFMDTMIRDHRELISKFEARAAASPANEIQKFAIDTLPRLRHHLQMATDIQPRISGQ